MAGKSLRILILEDNPIDAELVQFELQEAGFTFTSKVVMDEKDYVRELQKFSPDIILSDYDLPKYNGALALAEARRRCPDTPFILVTGAVSEDRAIEILTQGAKDYVLKTRLQQRLIPAVRRALAEAEEHRALKQAEAELRKAHITLEERVKIRTAELEGEITERKQAEKALRQMTERFDMAQRVANIGTWDWDILTGHIEWSTQMFNLFGIDPLTHTASFKLWNSILHPEDIEIAGRRIDQALGQQTSLNSDYRILLPDGKIRWISAVGEGKYDAKDRPIRMIGICMDITERKQVENALRESERLYRAIGESIDYGVWVCDPEGGNIYASESFLRLVGLTQEQCSNFGWGDVLHPADAERTMEAWKECVRTEGVWDIQHRVRGVDGQWHPILARGVPVHNEQGEVIYRVGINLDISNQKKAEMELEEQTRQLENANKELESFSYSISHDLKAPLRAIDGYSRMLVKKHGDKVGEDAARMLNVIRDNTERMGVLIDDLLSFSRMLKSSMTVSEINMDKLAHEIWDDIQAMHPERELEVRIRKLLPGLGDKALIRQVLSNLFSNAVKFTKERKPGIVEISCYAEPDQMVYCFKDNGVGFDMAYYHKLFGVFQRLHSLEEYEGTGVGLAIVHRIVHRHGGRVWAEGEVDKGAAFFFSLPSHLPDQAAS